MQSESDGRRQASKTRVFLIRSLPRRIAIFASLLLFLGLYCSQVLQIYIAFRSDRSWTIDGLTRAAALEPDNAEHLSHLSLYSLYVSQDADKAAKYAEQALKLNPYDADTWVHLAGYYQVLGDQDRQISALEHAVAADPTTPDVAREVGLLYLVSGNNRRALEMFRVVLANDPQSLDDTLSLCLRSGAPVEEILDTAVPPGHLDSLSMLLRKLIERRDFNAARSTWARMLELRKPFPIEASFGYFQFLVDQRVPDEASRAWSDMARVEPKLAPYLPGNNLVVNGSFENKLLNGGFDWHYYTFDSRAVLTLDSSRFHSGTRSLAVGLSGTIDRLPLSEYITVEPNTTYSFTGYMRAEDFLTASGPRFELVDAYTQQRFLLTDELLQSSVWQEMGGTFTTAPNTHLLVLRIVREPQGKLIKGTIWIDDLALQKKR